MKEVVLGIGNILKGDDGVGIYIAERVNKYLQHIKNGSKQDRFAEAGETIVIDCGTAPENYTSIIKKHNPDRLILVDAADMGLSPGSCRIIPPEEIKVMHISTHNMPLSFLISYISEFCRNIVLIGIQPDKMELGTILSRAVRRSGSQVANLIIEKGLNEIEVLKAQASDTKI